MPNYEISLLYPNEEAMEKSINGLDSPKITTETLESLELDYAIDLQGSRLCDMFTMSREVIEYRQGVFADLIENEELCTLLNKLLPIVSDIKDLRRLSSESTATDSYLYSITEIELYISAMELLLEGLTPIKDTFKSKAFCSLYSRVCELTSGEYYRDLNVKLKELTKRVREIRSVTVGVNLDSRLQPESAGVLSVNNEKFKSGELLQKILRLDFKNDEYTCIASLQPFKKGQSDNQQTALSNAFNSALGDVFKSSMRSWKRVVSNYVLENTDFLIKLAPEIEFVTKATELIKSLKETGNALSFPKIYPPEDKIFVAKGLYNPIVALKTGAAMVLNDFQFDENGTFYVLSGPNRGGKSVITCAVGHAFALAQLGLPVPAASLEISPVDGIFTHFPTSAEDTIDKGRLGEECARLDEIFEHISQYSLVLLDESLSSTGSYEASYIASEVLSGMLVCGCRGIFSTHLHELGMMIGDINERCKSLSTAKLDTLVAGIEDGERSFEILRQKPDGKSYASDIAAKYGISLEKIIKKIEKNI